jgi:nucleoside-diphosphate-sugar epimerase
MGSHLLPVVQNGIYHNLPQFDPDLRGLTAIIAGANGISGFATLRCLLDHPERWSKIYLVSRRPPSPALLKLLPKGTENNIQHIPIDLQSEVAAIAKQLYGVKADYIFYYAYLQPPPPPGAAVWSNDKELVQVNAAMLQKFLDASVMAGIKPKRFMLQTGAKNYGGHVGRARTPNLESDPQPRHLAPNFYYPQEDMLLKYCQDHDVDWNVVMPPFIIGAVENAQMNGLFPLAVYAAVAAERNEPLVFPYDWAAWQHSSHHGTARLTGYLTEWIVLEQKCANQRFNSQDTSPMSGDRLFEALAEWFGVEAGVTPPPMEETGMFEVTFGGGEKNPMG